MREFIKCEHSSIARSISELGECVQNKNVFAPANMPQVIFVCGANRFCAKTNSYKPSFRRDEFIKFLKSQFDNVHPFLAENVFNKLLEVSKKNIMRLEQDLFELSDNVAIILESNSAYCELGAFSHSENLRKKLLVVNDSQYERKSSFINQGPLDLISSENSEKSVFWYKMGNVESGCDSIADIYLDVEKLLESRIKRRSTKLNIKSNALTKNEMLFVRDLIAIAGPISGKEIVEILKKIFGDQDFSEIHTIIALLESISLISKKSDYYISESANLFFEYRHLDLAKIKSSFRVYALRAGRV